MKQKLLSALLMSAFAGVATTASAGVIQASYKNFAAEIFGADVAMTVPVIGYSLAHGRRANVPLVASVALGDSTALVFSLLGLGALLAASSFWFALVKGVGGVYLLYLGIRLLRAGMTPGQLPAPDAPGSRWRLFANTYLVTASNPKGIVFFVAFLPQFIDPARPVPPQLLLLAITFVAMATLNATLYAVFAGAARSVLASSKAQRGFNLAGGSLLSLAGVWALFARRAA